jgi:hypothetical protein
LSASDTDGGESVQRVVGAKHRQCARARNLERNEKPVSFPVNMTSRRDSQGTDRAGRLDRCMREDIYGGTTAVRPAWLDAAIGRLQIKAGALTYWDLENVHPMVTEMARALPAPATYAER